MLTQNHADIKNQTLGVLRSLAKTAEKTGMRTLVQDIQLQRIPKLEQEQFSLVVLGEFNHGKSTFVNALLGSVVLPAGITPTTATINHIVHATIPYAKAVLTDGTVYDVDPKSLQEWVTIDGANNDQVAYVEVGWPAPLLQDHITLVDTPGVNDINEARAEITYQYIPRADLVLFLLDGTQVLKQSERTFLEQRLLQRSKDKLLFLVGKSDLLAPEEKEETLRYCKQNLGKIVENPTVLAVSARLALQHDDARSGFPELVAYLREYLATQRAQVLLDNSLAEGLRLCSYVKQNIGIKRSALQLSLDELTTRVERVRNELAGQQQTLRQIYQTIQQEAGGIKAKVRLDLEDFGAAFCKELPSQIDRATPKDIQLYLQAFLQDTIKGWAEREGEHIANLLHRLMEQVIQITNENMDQTVALLQEELGLQKQQIDLQTDFIKYDVGLFALGALGTGIYLFVNTMVGGILTLAAPILGVVMHSWMGGQIKRQAKEQAPLLVQQALVSIQPRLDELVDKASAKLSDFVTAAGHTLYKSISEILNQTLAERKVYGQDTSSKQTELDETFQEMTHWENTLLSLREKLWTSSSESINLLGK